MKHVDDFLRWKEILIIERKKTRQNGDLNGKIFDEQFGGETKSTRGEILGSFHFVFWQREWIDPDRGSGT
jgi:hypothetical protein